MKKLLIIIGLILIIGACQKEDTNVWGADCKCGLIISDDVNNYSIDVRNDCTDNVKTFVLTEGDWMNAHPGEGYCGGSTW